MSCVPATATVVDSCRDIFRQIGDRADNNILRRNIRTVRYRTILPGVFTARPSRCANHILDQSQIAQTSGRGSDG
eukprot:scaffold131135_cov39-Prasinocladus_malaysianus.AAC.1